MKQKFCDICRAPAALMPCSRCVLPGPTRSDQSSPDRQQRPTRPILLEGKYRLQEELGRGGMGTVFRAFDEVLERPVAIKFLLPEIQALPTAVERFRREARAMASINDQNVVKVFSFGRYGEADFIVTEFVDGPTVEEMIDSRFRRGERVPLSQAFDILLQAARGLAAIHSAGVVHRDIKPGNIMFEPTSGRALIMDFGIGRRITREVEMAMVAPGGTPAYMAPEIIASREVNTLQEHLIDIYALGVSAFELLTGRLPFDGDTWIEVLEKHLEVSPPRPSVFRVELPSEVDEIILACLRKSPSERLQSAEAFREALRPLAVAIAEGKTSGPPSSARRRRQRRSTAPDGRPLHVVVADRDLLFRDAVFQLVREMVSCPISSAEVADRALLDRDPQGLSVFISSLHDKSLNGLELAAMLGAELDRRDAALILTAERVTPGERALLARLGAVQVVAKPLVRQEMREAFERALRSLGVFDFDMCRAGQADTVLSPER
jgi:serine/threonine protein kinase